MSKFTDIKKAIIDSPLFNNPFFIKYRILVAPFIVLIIALFIIVFIIVPQSISLINTFKTIDELNQKSKFFQKKQADLKNLNVDDYKKDLDTALIALPVNKDVPGIIGQLLVALSSSGMTLDGITLAVSSPESEKVEEFGIRLEISGSEDSLNNFLDRVKLSPRIIKLGAITISKSSSEKLSASVGLVTFYQLLPKSIGAVDNELPKISNNETQVLTDIASKAQNLRQTSPEEARTATGKLNPFAK